MTDTPTSIKREAPTGEKNCGQGLRLVGWRRALESPRRHFRPQKMDIKTLNSVTVQKKFGPFVDFDFLTEMGSWGID